MTHGLSTSEKYLPIAEQEGNGSVKSAAAHVGERAGQIQLFPTRISINWAMQVLLSASGLYH